MNAVSRYDFYQRTSDKEWVLISSGLILDDGFLIVRVKRKFDWGYERFGYTATKTLLIWDLAPSFRSENINSFLILCTDSDQCFPLITIAFDSFLFAIANLTLSLMQNEINFLLDLHITSICSLLNQLTYCGTLKCLCFGERLVLLLLLVSIFLAPCILIN